MLDTVVHKWFRVPHLLNVGYDNRLRHASATVVFVHGLASSHKLWEPMVNHLTDENYRIISVDLLGFGSSPRPEWQKYSATVQAQSLYLTLRALMVRGPLIIVGHSLGSLVAVKYASMYRKKASSLILCSPPFYKPPSKPSGPVYIPPQDDVYRRIYQYTRSKADLSLKVAATAKRAKLVDPNVEVSEATLPFIHSALEMSIENQTSLIDLEHLNIPVHIIYGKLDPFIVQRNITELPKKHANITVSSLLAMHEVFGNKIFQDKIVSTVKKTIENLQNVA